jgi:hypothetical protein
MSDLYLRAESESALYAALGAAGVVVETEGGQMTAPGYALDVIGPIEGAIGFHANLRGEISAEQSALLPVIAAPNNPVRVWY